MYSGLIYHLLLVQVNLHLKLYPRFSDCLVVEIIHIFSSLCDACVSRIEFSLSFFLHFFYSAFLSVCTGYVKDLWRFSHALTKCRYCIHFFFVRHQIAFCVTFFPGLSLHFQILYVESCALDVNYHFFCISWSLKLHTVCVSVYLSIHSFIFFYIIYISKWFLM